MIYHIPVGTTIRRMQSTSKDPKYTECFVTDREVYYTDKDLMKIEPENGTSSWSENASHGPVYIFLLPLSAKPWWSFHVYEDAIHRIHFVGTTSSGPRNEQELLQDLNSGKINPFETTPESQAVNGTAEQRIIGRSLTPRERAEIKEQWDNEDENLCRRLNFPIDITYKKLKTVQPIGFYPKDFYKNWIKPLTRPLFPVLPKDLLPKKERPTELAEAIAWDIDLEIMAILMNGLWRLEAPGNTTVFYLDYKYSKGK